MIKLVYIIINLFYQNRGYFMKIIKLSIILGTLCSFGFASLEAGKRRKQCKNGMCALNHPKKAHRGRIPQNQPEKASQPAGVPTSHAGAGAGAGAGAAPKAAAPKAAAVQAARTRAAAQIAAQNAAALTQGIAASRADHARVSRAVRIANQNDAALAAGLAASEQQAHADRADQLRIDEAVAQSLAQDQLPQSQPVRARSRVSAGPGDRSRAQADTKEQRDSKQVDEIGLLEIFSKRFASVSVPDSKEEANNFAQFVNGCNLTRNPARLAAVKGVHKIRHSKILPRLQDANRRTQGIRFSEFATQFALRAFEVPADNDPRLAKFTNETVNWLVQLRADMLARKYDQSLSGAIDYLNNSIAEFQAQREYFIANQRRILTFASLIAHEAAVEYAKEKHPELFAVSAHPEADRAADVPASLGAGAVATQPMPRAVSLADLRSAAPRTPGSGSAASSDDEEDEPAAGAGASTVARSAGAEVKPAAIDMTKAELLRLQTNIALEKAKDRDSINKDNSYAIVQELHKMILQDPRLESLKNNNYLQQISAMHQRMQLGRVADRHMAVQLEHMLTFASHVITRAVELLTK